MSKRLQVLLDEQEFEEIREIASQNHMTVAEWVRQALRVARRQNPRRSVQAKMRVLKEAVRHSYPTADIDQILGEIEAGYAGKKD